MIDTEVIIVGAGPAGAACAATLREAGIPFVLLDRRAFPRDKRCAGWITPAVFRTLGIRPGDYPYPLTRYREFIIHAAGRRATLKVEQYAIRRYEFDLFLLQHNDLRPLQHEVKEIREEKDHFLIDGAFRGRYLVGAGGSYCPVVRHFFPALVQERALWISAMEEEFRYPWDDGRCRLWFDIPGLPGYAWYVPKADGYLNIGIGGYTARMKAHGTHIGIFWKQFTALLEGTGLLKGKAPAGKGYNYRVRGREPQLQRGRIYLAGDAAGLATVDMGEGIGPALESGRLVAQSIITGKPVRVSGIRKRSFPLLPTAAHLAWNLFVKKGG